MIESAPAVQGRWLHRALRGAVAVAFALQVGLLVFVVLHNFLSPGAALDSDFSPSWLGGSVWRTLGPGHGYDAAAQLRSTRMSPRARDTAGCTPTPGRPARCCLGFPSRSSR